MSRALGLLLGVALDAVVGDPRRFHPVAGFGRWAGWLEGRLNADSHRFLAESHRFLADSHRNGVIFTATALAPVVTLGVATERITRRHPLAHALATALATWAALGARSLVAEGTRMADRLDSGDLTAARAQLPNLCGRAPERLDAAELGRATVESLAENTNDGVVATLFWGAIAGVPGILAHRGANTLDAMVGHRNERYATFGTASARLDDALGWIPARLTGVLACVAARLVGGSTTRAWRTMVRDHADHPSPNGGWCESAWAGTLGVRLGGTNTYGDRVEVRGTLGDPDAPRPDADGVRRAARLVGWVTVAAAVGAATLSVVVQTTGGKAPSGGQQ